MAGEFDLDGCSGGFAGAAGVVGPERGAQAVAELPCGVGVEGGETQEGFLLGEDVEVFGGVHDALLSLGSMVAVRVADCRRSGMGGRSVRLSRDGQSGSGRAMRMTILGLSSIYTEQN